MNEARGILGFKGERGYSAYEVACQNGYVGSESDWLAQLGTSSHFNQIKKVYTTESSESTHPMPEEYNSNCFLDIYVGGKRLNLNEYTYNDTEITYTPPLEAHVVVEIVISIFSTNNLPIVQAIDEHSVDTTVPSSKSVYLLKKDIDDKKLDKTDALFFESEEEIDEE